jgi:zinc/manganese transport system ATP-binding protein
MDLRAGYAGQPAIEGLSGTVAPGSLTAIVGANGAGKTTLLRTMVGLLKPLSGQVELGGLGPGSIAYLPQHAEIDRSFPVSVGDVVMLGHWPRAGAFGALGRAARRAAEQGLAEVGLETLWRRPIGALSQGQFAAVDARTTADLLAIVARWHREGRTIVAALHDLEQVRAHFPETLLLARSCIAWGRTARVLTQENLLRAWGVAAGWDAGADARASVAPAA